jgi:hypothetical protein
VLIRTGVCQGFATERDTSFRVKCYRGGNIILLDSLVVDQSTIIIQVLLLVTESL